MAANPTPSPPGNQGTVTTSEEDAVWNILKLEYIRPLVFPMPIREGVYNTLMKVFVNIDDKLKTDDKEFVKLGIPARKRLEDAVRTWIKATIKSLYSGAICSSVMFKKEQEPGEQPKMFIEVVVDISNYPYQLQKPVDNVNIVQKLGILVDAKELRCLTHNKNSKVP